MNPVDLSGLRDIHIPHEPSWWPLAPGWWLVIIGMALVLLIGGIFFLYWWTRPKQYAQRSLKKLFISEQNPIVLARGVSALLKRVALSNFPRTKVARLSEQKWIDFLQKKAPDSFSAEELDLLAHSKYMPETHTIEIPMEHLYQSGRKAIQYLFRKEKNGK